MGRIIIVALQQRDYVVIQSVVVLIVMLVLVLNLVLDIVYAWVNPRIRYT
jgi:peptide/nickel transport system permease protein